MTVIPQHFAIEISCRGVIQGDGVDYESVPKILAALRDAGAAGAGGEPIPPRCFAKGSSQCPAGQGCDYCKWFAWQIPFFKVIPYPCNLGTAGTSCKLTFVSRK